MYSSLIRINPNDYVSKSNSLGNQVEESSYDRVDIFGLSLDEEWRALEITQGVSVVYDLIVPTTGNYQLFAQVGSTLDRNEFRFSLGQISEFVRFDMSDSWQNIPLKGLSLESGRHQLRLEMLSSGFQLNAIEVLPISAEHIGESDLTSQRSELIFDSKVEHFQHSHVESLSDFLNIGEVGSITGLTHQRRTIELNREYINPVVFVQGLSSYGRQPAIVRLSNIQNNSFEVFLQEPSNLDGKHVGEDVSYFVLEAGSWFLEDGTKIEVGTVDSQILAKEGFESVSFEQTFTESPVLFSQVQTFNGADFVRTRQRGTTETGFQVALEEEEKKQFSGHKIESIGWFALESGVGNWNGLEYQAGQTADVVTHEWSSVELNGFESTPNLLTSLATYDGEDPAGIRYQNLTGNRVEIRVEEDTSADKETWHTTESVSFLALEGNGFLTGVSSAQKLSSTQVFQGRDVLKQPFASDSIWNTPIGSNAVYVDAQIAPAKKIAADVDHFYVLNGDDPLRPLYDNGTWGPGRSTGSVFQGIALPIPDDFMVDDATNSKTPNNSAAFLMPDGRTLVQVNALARDREGGHLFGQRLPYTPSIAIYEDIYGSGTLGGHGGSGLSSIGGTLRLGELTGSEPIQHALKVNLWSKKYFSSAFGAEGGLGYRWPAITADAHLSPETYGGLVPELLNGSLLAIPPDITPESLGIQTDAGKKLFYAFQDYGAYVADDTGWDAHAITVEKGVGGEFKETYGYGFTEKNTAFFDDFMQLFTALHVVDNNALDNIGGGGTPRVSPALPLLDEPSNAFLGTEGADHLIGDSQANRLDGKSGHDLLEGGDNHDFMTGGSGDDSLLGGSGNDNLIGDSGRDLLNGDRGDDYLDGGSHRDTLNGGEGDDYLSGGTGPDKFLGGVGFDTVIESGEDDYVLTNRQLISTWTDSLDSIEHVILSGNNRNNRLDASTFTQGSVELHGGRGHDNLLGGSGNDQLVSSSGKDRLMGGAGSDLFDLVGRSILLTSSHSNSYRSGEYALILDFKESEDTLVLKGKEDQYKVDVFSENNLLGSAIYFDGNGDGRHDVASEIIAVLKDVDTLNLGLAQYQ